MLMYLPIYFLRPFRKVDQLQYKPIQQMMVRRAMEKTCEDFGLKKFFSDLNRTHTQRERERGIRAVRMNLSVNYLRFATFRISGINSGSSNRSIGEREKNVEYREQSNLLND